MQYFVSSSQLESEDDSSIEIKFNLGKDGPTEKSRKPEETLENDSMQVQQGRQRLVGDQYNYYSITPDSYQQRRPMYVPYQPQPSQNPYYYPDYIVPPRQIWPFPPTTTTTTTTPGPIRPIGYMLMDTYHSKRGAYTRPVAFFTT